MSTNTRSKQIIVIGAIVLLIGFLFTRDIKGLVKPKDDGAKASTGMQAEPTSVLTIEQASVTAKNLVSNSFGKEITLLENDFQSATGADRVSKAKVLAQKWDDVEQAIPSTLYLEVVAEQEPTLNNWLATGDRALKALDNTQDTAALPVMLQKANNAFTKALKLDSNSLDAKTGLGITIVNGMGAPMQGIAMLQDVVRRDPKNFKANMNLGLFALKSGQYDKAVTRFNTIITEIKATPDAYMYLGTAYESLGQNQAAIEAYLKSKKMAANPTLTSFIDRKVAELKNKR